jgi:NAD-dependent deacetylase
MTGYSYLFFTGAGMSAGSGVPLFRGKGGRWTEKDFREVASPGAWKSEPQKVLDFYNDRRRHLHSCAPNAGHRAIADMGRRNKMHVVTQNVDDLHERAGSTDVLHLHGELLKARSTGDGEVIPWLGDINIGDKGKDGSQLRPHIVWFGEGVLEFRKAQEYADAADVIVCVGSSLVVQPAASLVFDAVAQKKIVVIIDPNDLEVLKDESLPFASGKYLHVKRDAISGLEYLRHLGESGELAKEWARL